MEPSAAPPDRLAPPSLDTVVTIFIALAGWHANLNPIGDNSTFCHLRTGQWMLAHGLPRTDIFTFTAAGSSWVPESWLADLVYGAIDRLAGTRGLVFFHAMLGATIGALWFRIARRLNRDTMRATIVTLLSIAACYTLWSPRPLMIGILCFLALVFLVEISDWAFGGRAALLMPPLLWLWANTHGSFVLGFAYLGLHLAGRWMEGAPPWQGSERRLVIGGVLALGAGLINPYGWRLLVAPFYLAARYETLRGVVEWRHAGLGSIQGIAYLVWLAAFGATLIIRPREVGARGLIVSLPFFALGLMSERNIAIAPIVSFPFVARAWAIRDERAPNRNAFNWAMVALAALLLIRWTSPALRRPGLDFTGYPVGAMKAVGQRGLLGSRLLTTDKWGDYVVLVYGPRQRVFMDDRYVLYPRAVTDAMSALLNGRGDWPQVIRDYHVSVVVWPAADPSPAKLSTLPGWRKIYQDRIAAVYTNSG
jgi:hypothetical protein